MTTDEGLLAGACRSIRAVRAREDAPWPGTLVRTAAGDARVLVDAADLGSRWTGWKAPPDGHVLAPLDVMRRVDGHDVVLPVCADRLEDFVQRRGDRLALTLGETVTLGVSMLRGCTQIAAHPETLGEWWLDEDGRPVLATEASPRRALDASADVLAKASVPAHAAVAWEAAQRAVSAARISVHELAAAEELLFQLCPPEPLSTASLSPRHAAAGFARAPERSDPTHERQEEPTPRSMWQTLVGSVDDDLADTVSRATTAVWRRLRQPGAARPPARRRSLWLVSAGVAAAVLAGGALWPAGSGLATDGGADLDQAPASAPTSTPATAERPTATPTLTSEATDPAGASSADAESTDLVRVADALLVARLACHGDDGCLSTVTLDAVRLPGGVIDLPQTERTVTLLDSFGDLAVLRVDASDATAPAQLVVILRTDDKWLLRDVSDVAQQP